MEHRDVFGDVKNTKLDQPRRANGSSNLDESSLLVRLSSGNIENSGATPSEVVKRPKKDQTNSSNKAITSSAARKLLPEKEGNNGNVSDGMSSDHANIESKGKSQQGSTPKKVKLSKVDSAGSKASKKRLKRL